MCEFCGYAGHCIVCGANENPADAVRVGGNLRIAQLRAQAAEREIRETEARLRKLRTELPALLLAAGRRPGDGSDQPDLFDAQPLNLFTVEA